MKQHMVAGASMQLFMRTLQAANVELSQQVRQAVAANPALEELPPTSEQETDTSCTNNYEATRRHSRFMDSLAEEETLQSYLEQQVRTSALPRDVERAALHFVEHIDEHGRFTIPPADIATAQGIPPALYKHALQVIQELEPAGVGAQDLRESLILQLLRAGEKDSIAMQLLRTRWDDLVNHRYESAARKLGIDTNLVKLAARRIARLNPDPGSSFAKIEQNIISPDLIVSRRDNELDVQLTGEGIPRLTLSAGYRNMMAEHAEKPELRQYLSRCFREGRDLIRAIDQRQQTILTVAKAIVSHQRDFFFYGHRSLKPLRQEDIANTTGLHISTISRAVNGKFLRCEFGVFELRFFFSAALATTNHENASAAAAVQERIRHLIAHENPATPLSDADIACALANDGIAIARRTIAKYRDKLRILPAQLRKKL